jgi:hypothetical protein
VYSAGVTTDLNDISPDPALTITAARDINDDGVICATATGADDPLVGVLFGP